MHMYVDVSIVGRQAYAPTAFLMLHYILQGLIYYQQLSAHTASRVVLTDANFLCDKAGALGENIK